MSLPRKYRCVKPLIVQRYDEEGYHMPGQAISVAPGTEFTKNGMLFLADPPAVRLEGADGLWMEIGPETLEAHFEEVTDETDSL